jgi:hypothetical protein
LNVDRNSNDSGKLAALPHRNRAVLKSLSERIFNPQTKRRNTVDPDSISELLVPIDLEYRSIANLTIHSGDMFNLLPE